MKKLLVIVCAALFLAGCNTISGIGRDIEAAGGAVDKTATDTKKKM